MIFISTISKLWNGLQLLNSFNGSSTKSHLKGGGMQIFSIKWIILFIVWLEYAPNYFLAVWFHGEMSD